jgi:serine/threonine protein kinase
MPGTINQYEIRRTLGTGFSCKVKLGVDTTNNRKVAIKIIKDCADEQLMELVRTEC